MMHTQSLKYFHVNHLPLMNIKDTILVSDF
nr:MAG TPA_asm: hypothetical protein [Caudoviricetes sp.]